MVEYLSPENADDGVADAAKELVRRASDDLFERGIMQRTELGRSLVALLEILNVNWTARDGPQV